MSWIVPSFNVSHLRTDLKICTRKAKLFRHVRGDLLCFQRGRLLIYSHPQTVENDSQTAHNHGMNFKFSLFNGPTVHPHPHTQTFVMEKLSGSALTAVISQFICHHCLTLTIETYSECSLNGFQIQVFRPPLYFNIRFCA